MSNEEPHDRFKEKRKTVTDAPILPEYLPAYQLADRERRPWAHVPAETPGPDDRYFTLWAEGYAATGEHGTASVIGESWGKSLDDAVWRLLRNNPSPHLHTYLRRSDDGTWTYWGCRIFDNETDARKSFG